MAKLLKLRRGTTTQHSSFTGAEGEVTIDTTKDTAVVHDGSQAGGRPLAREDMSNVSSIAGTKIAPDFGSQNVVTTGTLGSGDLTITDNSPQINFTDGDGNPDYRIRLNTGVLSFYDTTNSADRIVINTDGHVDVTGNLDVGAGVDITGNMTVTGTVDGRDVAADGTKLDGIESGATADQTKSDIDGLNINADQVDSLHANQFLRSDTADTADADITFNGGAGAVTIAAQSDIRLNNGGTWTGDVDCKLQHHANILYINYPDAGSARFRDSAGNDNLQLDSAGNLTATGNVTAYSDARLKTDVNTINDALGIVGKLRGVSYKWIATDKPSIGVIAQEIEEVIPEVVLTNRNTNPSTGETTEIKSVDYGKIVGVLINAINELKAEVDALKKPKKKGGK